MSTIELCACSHSASAAVHRTINGETRCYGLVAVVLLPGEPRVPGPCDCRELRLNQTAVLL